MYAVGGYINGNAVIANESISSYEGYEVIITILDTMKEKKKDDFQTSLEEKRKIALQLAGLWKDHNDDRTVDEVVRSMRKGRSFDY